MIKCKDSYCLFNTAGPTMCCKECGLEDICANFCSVAEDDEWKNCEYMTDTDRIQYE